MTNLPVGTIMVEKRLFGDGGEEFYVYLIDGFDVELITI